MHATFVFVPPGGGEADYSLDFDIPAPPHPGDYIEIFRGNESGTCDFIVRRTWWHLAYPTENSGPSVAQRDIRGTTMGLMVECEFSEGPHVGESHKRAITAYPASRYPFKKFEDTAF